MTPTILEHWNQRAALGEKAGTQDLGLVKLERREIATYVQPHMRVLDVGCGTGETLAGLDCAEKVGWDFSPAMLEATPSGVSFYQVDITSDEWPTVGGFDLVYTQRCLINLPDWESQYTALKRLARLVRPGGRLVLVEHNHDALMRLNALRARVGLPSIEPPWHNRYLRESEMADLQLDVSHFSSTYYFITRIVNAWQAAQEGREPSYDAPINQLGLMLPPMCGHIGQACAWVWKR